jgi:hypothetical protein
VLFASTSTASAESKCKAGKGTPIFEARFLAGNAKVITKLFATGMWTRVATTPSHEPSKKTGCIEATTLDEIKAALKAAKWKKTKAQAQCLGVHSDTTELYAGGIKRFTRKTCGAWEIDEASAKLVEKIGRQIPDGFALPIWIDSAGGDL